MIANQGPKLLNQIFTCKPHCKQLRLLSRIFLCKPHSNQFWLLKRLLIWKLHNTQHQVPNQLLMCKPHSSQHWLHSPNSSSHNQFGEGNDIVPIQSAHNLSMHVSDSFRQNIIQVRFIELHTLHHQGPSPGQQKLLINSEGEIITKENV